MTKKIKLLLIALSLLMVIVSVFALCSCDGLFGDNGLFGGGGGGGGDKQEKLTAEYDTGYKVYVGDSLDTVKRHLTVTYTHKDGGIQTVSDYDLTGTIAEGECTLTVSYQGLTTTVKVTVVVNTNPLNLGFKLLNESDSYALNRVPEAVDELVIPSTYEGKAVTSIASGTFNWNSALTSITIPASITKIDSMASTVSSVYYDGTVADWCEIQFKGTSTDNTTNPMKSASNFYIKSGDDYVKLTSVAIPEGVESIGNYQFCGFTDITSVSISNSVTSIGDYAFYNCESITSLTIGNKVETIGERAFYQSKGLTSLIIPDSVTEVGDAAFYNCSKLMSLTLGNNVMVIGSSSFYNCSSLTEVTIPDSVEVVRDYAFANGGFTTLTIGKGVKEVYDYAFNDCTELENVYYNGTIADWCGIEFKKDFGSSGGYRNPMYYASKFYLKNVDNDGYSLLTDLVIPDGVTTIGEYQFFGFGALNSVIIPNSVTSIKTYAFDGCTFATEATIPYCAVSSYIAAPTMVITNGTTIASYAFQNRNAYKTSIITSLTLPDTLTSIEHDAFDGCSGLTSIEIPENVTSIGDFAFIRCTNLEQVTLYNNLTRMGNSVFRYCSKIANVYYNGTINDWCNIAFGSTESNPMNGGNGKFYIKNTDDDDYVELTSIVIPQEVTSISDYQFLGFGVTSVEFHSNVQTIGVRAFENCKYITSVMLPEGVMDIGSSAFSGCTSLATVSIPDTIERVGGSAFKNCASSAFTVDRAGNSGSDTTSVKYLGNVNNPYLVLCSASLSAKSKDYVVQEGTKIIVGDSFWENRTITSITIPTSVKYIGETAFYNCAYLNTVNYNGTIAEWCDISINSVIVYELSTNRYFYIKNTNNDNYTEVKDLVIPEGVTSIGKYQFACYNNITSISLPESLTYIGEKAFFKCGNINSIDIPDNVTEISTYAFYQCSALETLTFGNSVAIIGDNAFSGCSNLQPTQAPTSLVSLGTGVFSSCGEDFFAVYENASYWGNDDNPYWILVKGTSTTTTIHEDTKVIAVRAFAGTTIKSIVIPDRVESIGESAFDRCQSLASITIGSGVKYVGPNAFYMSVIADVYYNGTIADWCNIEIHDNVFQSTTKTNHFYVKNSDDDGYTEVTEIVIPDDVVEIQAQQFYAFNSVTKIIIGKNVTCIGRDAFDFCKKIRSIQFEGTVEEWNAIEKTSWISTDMTASRVTCSDGVANLF